MVWHFAVSSSNKRARKSTIFDERNEGSCWSIPVSQGEHRVLLQARRRTESKVRAASKTKSSSVTSNAADHCSRNVRNSRSLKKNSVPRRRARLDTESKHSSDTRAGDTFRRRWGERWGSAKRFNSDVQENSLAKRLHTFVVAQLFQAWLQNVDFQLQRFVLVLEVGCEDTEKTGVRQRSVRVDA